MAVAKAAPPAITPRLLSREQAAAYCGVSEYVFEARCPVAPIMLGSRKRWDVRALDRWLDQQSGLDQPTRPLSEWLEKLDADAARRN